MSPPRCCCARASAGPPPATTCAFTRAPPSSATTAQDLQAWQGAPHAGLVHEFENVSEGHGFLIEGAQYTTGVAASAVPFTDGASHKRLMAGFSRAASFIGLLRDRGHGRVTLDAAGMAVPWYSITDELDLQMTQRSIEAQVELHRAAGAQQIVALAAGAPVWREGDDVERLP